MIGEKLGPYEILESIGSGGMGEVWKARDTRLGRIVAIKKAKEQHSERFKQEARSVAALNHPNICQIFDIGDDYLVLEYVEGKPLSSPLPEQEAVRLAIQIAVALEEAHRRGIIHRDLKPSNIMVTDKGSVKLLDFGLAKLYGQDASISGLPTSDMPATQIGAVLGTIAYMSPEQAQGQPVDLRSDIFSFGLVFYEMLSGRRAFSGDNPLAIISAVQKEDPPPLKASPSLRKIIGKCLEKQLSARYQTVSEIRVELEKVFEDKASKSSTELRPSIAVLPFVNMSGDKEQEYFSDGLAEEIINALTHISGLKVIARTSAFAFKDKQEDIRRIAEVLGVANILEGSVRKAGDRIRVTAQLVTAADGSHLWSERYDRDLTDIFAIQDEIATAIAKALQVELSVTPSARRRYEPTLAAHEAYLKARYHYGKFRPESLARCKEYFEKAIMLDSKFALAHCSYADLFVFLAIAGYMPAREAMPLVRKEALKALAIDPSLPEAHAMLGIVAGVYDYDWKEAERRFHLAMTHGPVPPRIRIWYGWFYLVPMGRYRESVEQQEQGLKEDPIDITGHTCLSWTLFFAGKLSDAQVAANRILELEENYVYAMMLLSHIYASQEKWTEALRVAEKAFPMIPMAMGTLAGVLKRTGAVDESEKLAQKLLQGKTYEGSFGLVQYYYLCKETDAAANWVEKAIEERVPGIAVFARTYIRPGSRWRTLAKLMNLPE